MLQKLLILYILQSNLTFYKINWITLLFRKINFTRSKKRKKMTQQESDVIVIGAGISGAALFTSLQDILILKILL